MLGAWQVSAACTHAHTTRHAATDRRGHLRTGATGRNFNREWAAPDREEAPEVFSVLKMMEREGAGAGAGGTWCHGVGA
jgi:murein tripeptide amidase MpaA